MVLLKLKACDRELKAISNAGDRDVRGLTGM